MDALCTRCGKSPAQNGFKVCARCFSYLKEYRARYVRAPKQKGQCPRKDCSNTVTPGFKSCERCRTVSREYSRQIKSKRQVQQRRIRETKKSRVFSAYGGAVCACCEEDFIEFLTIDHTNGDGASHRKREPKAKNDLYAWLIQNQFPEGFRVLCMNCNFSLGKHGYCPHSGLVQPCTNGRGKTPKQEQV